MNVDESESQEQGSIAASAEVAVGVPTEEERKNVEALNDEQQEERWYLADDGKSYFRDRREPFFRFNLLAYMAAMGAFIYLAVVITEDYIEQQANPPTTNKVNKEIQQPFPGMILCNRDVNAPLDVLLALFDETGQSDEIDVNIADQIQPLVCDGQSNNCIILDGDFPAFSADPDDISSCGGANSIAIVLDVNLDSYGNRTWFAGIEGYLFTPGSGADIAEAFCATSAPSCQSSVPTSDDCPEDVSAVAFEPFVASSSQGTHISLKRTEIQLAPNCGQTLLSWNPIGTTMHFVPSSLISRGLNVSDSVVFLSFEFVGPRVSKTTYNPISGQSMFGSLSGWFGFLTDGWGAISILFFTERTFLFLRNRLRL